MSNKELELKIKYNKIIKIQDDAMIWFDSEDFKNKFNSETFRDNNGNLLAGGVAFIERAALRYRKYDKMRTDILNELEQMGIKTTTNDIIYGFTVKEV